MSWDVSTPPDSESIRSGASRIRELKTDLVSAFGTEFSFPGGVLASPVLIYTPKYGSTASRPAFGNAGRLYINSDTLTIQRDTGAAWADITAPSSLMPVSTILPYAGNPSVTPTGYLYCNGQAISRTTYADLFAKIGTTWGQGDGSTTFNVPDLRGVVIRGWNDTASDGFIDPDSASRTARLTGGATANNVGSFQQDALAAHTHTYTGSGGSGFAGGVSGGFGAQVTGSTGGNETRGKNAFVGYIIRY